MDYQPTAKETNMYVYYRNKKGVKHGLNMLGSEANIRAHMNKLGYEVLGIAPFVYTD